MKLIAIISLLFLCTSFSKGQELTEKRKNLIYADAAGPIVVGLGLGYERYLHAKPNLRFSLRGGAGVIDNFSKATSYLGTSFLYGNKSNLEAGINYLFKYDASTFRMDDDSQFNNGIQSIIGYRYQNWNNGITFRIYYVLPIGCCGSFIPVYSGLSLGYAF